MAELALLGSNGTGVPPEPPPPNMAPNAVCAAPPNDDMAPETPPALLYDGANGMAPFTSRYVANEPELSPYSTPLGVTKSASAAASGEQKL